MITVYEVKDCRDYGIGELKRIITSQLSMCKKYAEARKRRRMKEDGKG
jgi:hypothetical protein